MYIGNNVQYNTQHTRLYQPHNLIQRQHFALWLYLLILYEKRQQKMFIDVDVKAFTNTCFICYIILVNAQWTNTNNCIGFKAAVFHDPIFQTLVAMCKVAIRA